MLKELHSHITKEGGLQKSTASMAVKSSTVPIYVYKIYSNVLFFVAVSLDLDGIKGIC